MTEQKTIAELLKTLETTVNCLKWAAQEARGRVDREKVGGWTYHANEATKTIAKIKKQIPQNSP